MVVAGASHCHHALASFGAWPKPKIRSGVGLGTSSSPHGPGWSRSAQPEKPLEPVNDHPLVSLAVSSGDRVRPGLGGGRGERGAESSAAAAAAPSTSARRFTGGPFGETGGSLIVSPAPVTAPDRRGRNCAPELSRAV